MEIKIRIIGLLQDIDMFVNTFICRTPFKRISVLIHVPQIQHNMPGLNYVKGKSNVGLTTFKFKIFL